MDRGIQFKYLDGTSKLGFFGYDETTTTESEKYFTYVPDATNNANVFTGTRGRGSRLSNLMMVFRMVLHSLISTTESQELFAGTADQDTSYQLLTVTSSGVPVWTTTFDGGTCTDKLE